MANPCYRKYSTHTVCIAQLLDSCAVYRRDGALLNVSDMLHLPRPTARVAVQRDGQHLLDPGLVHALQGGTVLLWEGGWVLGS